MTVRLTGRHPIVLFPATLLLAVASAPWEGASAPTLGAPTPEEPPATVPTEAIEAPASLSRPGVVAPGTRRGADDEVVAASASNIPDAALAAYQRAETVINTADPTCNISWQLIAAIGRVESDHGRVNGNSLDDDGLATPGIYGIPLDGSHNTAVIRDTDAGQYDSDARWDRAVGPMQFIPSTWSVVGVDGDNDGKRNPQDVDDAALATAVYLCSGEEDLSLERGQRAAVYRYNHSFDYVDLVVSLMSAYLEGDFTTFPSTYGSSSVSLPRSWTERPDLEKASLRSDSGRSSRERDAKADARNDDRAPDQAPGPETEEPTPAPDGGDGGTEPEGPGTPADPDGPTETPPPTDPGGETEPPTDAGGETGTPANPGGEEPTEEPAPDDGGGPADPPDEPEATPTQDEAVAECLAVVGATSADPAELEALGVLGDYTSCMAGLGF